MTEEENDNPLDPVADLHERRRRIREEMGGADRVARMRAEGTPTIRDHIDGVLDSDSFRELGTHGRSMRLEDRHNTPGDGKVGGIHFAVVHRAMPFEDDPRGAATVDCFKVGLLCLRLRNLFIAVCFLCCFCLGFSFKF